MLGLGDLFDYNDYNDYSDYSHHSDTTDKITTQETQSTPVQNVYFFKRGMNIQSYVVSLSQVHIMTQN